jgi:hypothetical protein
VIGEASLPDVDSRYFIHSPATAAEHFREYGPAPIDGEPIALIPTKLSQPFTRWSLRKLVAYLRKVHGRLGLGRARTSRLKSISSGRPDGAAPIYVIMDNLSAHKGADIRRWARRNQVELCFTPTYASWANPIEAHFGPLRQFTIASSNYPNHTVQKTRALPAYLGWRNANARHRDVLAAERKERARIRSEKGIRWGGGPLVAAA